MTAPTLAGLGRAFLAPGRIPPLRVLVATGSHLSTEAERQAHEAAIFGDHAIYGPEGVRFWRALREAFWSLMTPIILLGAMFSGIASPTEASILAAIYTIILAGFIYRELTLREFFDALLTTATDTLPVHNPRSRFPRLSP